MREWLEDPEAPWWAKLRRAQVHINEVRQRVDALQSAGIWSIEREPAADGCSYRFRLHRADGWAYRFRINRAVPADLLAAVGDAVANMRSALDYVAYELARHHVVEMGGEMGDEEEAATAFPIHVNQASFDRFFVVGRRGPVRNRLYGDVERKALQCVQPFALADEARAVGVEPSTDPQDDLLTDHAYALNAVWNIDKHRRLPEVAWTLGNLVWWSRDGAAYQWIGHIGEFAPLEDGTVLGELHNRSGSGRPEVDPHLEIEIVLADDPSPYKSPLVARLERLHRSLAGWVIPRVFIVAEGNPPPMMISFSPPS
jgi:hypothetical protein